MCKCGIKVDESQINPGLLKEPVTAETCCTKTPSEAVCKSCAFYVEKPTASALSVEVGFCRRHAPTMKGYPTVFPADWCGEYCGKSKFNKEKLLCG